MSSSSTPAPPSTTINPHEDICDFYLVKKKRFCKIVKRCVELQRLAAAKAAITGVDAASTASSTTPPATPSSLLASQQQHQHQHQHFCAMHQQELAAGIAVGNGVARGDAQRGLVSGMVAEVDRRGLRVPCPLNPNHTVYEKDVQRHIKICPDRRFIVTSEPYYVKSLHAFAGCYRYDVAGGGVGEASSTSVVVSSGGGGVACTVGSVVTRCGGELSKVVSRVPVVPISSDMEADLEMKAAIVTASKEVKAGSNIKDQQDTKRNAKMSADKHHHQEHQNVAVAATVTAAAAAEVDEDHMPIEEEDDSITVNITTSSSNTPKKRYTHRDLPPVVLASLIDRIHTYYHTHVSKYIEVLKDVSKTDDAMVVKEEEQSGVGGGQQQQNLKHDPQHDRLHKLIMPLLVGGSGGDDNDALTVVEMGAGKAGLGASLVEALLKPNPSIASPFPSNTITRALRVLVSDLGGFRRKADAGAQALISRSLIPPTSTTADTIVSSSQLLPKVLSYKRLRCNLKDLNLPAALLHNNNNSTTDNNKNSEKAGAIVAGTKRDRDEGVDVVTVSKQIQEEFISIGKHLCGACTDFAISCSALGSSSSSTTSATSCFESSSLSLLVGGSGGGAVDHSIPLCKGLVIATCCHHRCEPQHMCFPQSVVPSLSSSPLSTDDSTSSPAAPKGSILAGSSAPYFIPTLEELTNNKNKNKNVTNSENIENSSCGINTLEELHALISITSWAVSGAHAVPNPRRREAGRNAKRIIDFHRAMFLERILNSQSSGAMKGGRRYRVRMVEYINAGITPENLALVVDIAE